MTIHDDLVARYGKPERLPNGLDGLVLSFAHATEESAAAYAGANEVRGHPAAYWADESGRWLSVVDLRPAIDRLKAEFSDGVGP